MVERVRLKPNGKLPATTKRGRPSGCTDAVVRATRHACKLGAIDSDLAKMFGVSTVTINNWKHSSEEFFWAMKAGKEEANHTVERSLFKSAQGSYYEEEEAKVIQISKFEQKVVKETVKKYLPPNVTAQIFFLKNRMPEEYRDRHDFEGKVEVQAERNTAKDRFFNKLTEHFKRLDARRGITQIEGEVVNRGNS